jgi:outer membrane protein OmpA-like peptidoglycan-associated protein
MKQELGAVKKINEFCGCLSSIPAISCVSVQVCPKHKFVNKSIGYIVNYVGGYVTIYKPHGENVGILQIKDYTSLTRVDLDVTDTMGTGSEFSIATNFKTSFLAAKTANTGGIAIGYSKTQFIMDSDFQEFSVYFELNSSTIQFDYIQGDYSNGGNNGNLNKALSALAELLKNTQGLTIDIEGHTDSSGSDAMNKDLGQRRGDAVRDYLIKLGVTDMTKFKVVSKGEELAKAEGDSKRNPKFRKTTIKLAADSPDYIYFKAGKINPSATPLITAPDNNKFVYLSPTPPPPPASSTEKIEFDFDGVSYKIEPASLHAPNTPPPYTASSGFSSWWEKFDYDKTGDGDNIVHYLLYKETDICCTVYSQQKSDLNIEAKESESKYYVFENINESSLAHRDVQKIKDPSTVAVAATLDLHTAKKTEISMSGNASISAHLIAIPPPDGFGVIIQIINNYNNTFIYQ